MLSFLPSDAIFESQAEQNAYKEVSELDRIVVSHPALSEAVTGIRGCIKASIASRSRMHRACCRSAPARTTAWAPAWRA